MKKTSATLLSLCLASSLAQAGRPLGTDDASTAAAQTCQLEAWYEHSNSELTTVLAPACGVAEGLELDLGLALPAQRHELLLGSGVAVKWVPTAWATSTPLGELAFGLKGSLDFEHPAGSGWRQADSAGLILASLQANEQWALHLNLGRGQWRPAGQPQFQASLFNAAAVWTPTDQGLLFAEWQGNSRRADLGSPNVSVGGRWWLQKDKLGLDLTVGRETASGSPTQVTLGFGWYGLGF